MNNPRLDQDEYQRYLELRELAEILEDAATKLGHLYLYRNADRELQELLDGFDDMYSYVLAEREELEV